jgi:glycosyltransferase involved in cell wall biosynthesis
MTATRPKTLMLCSELEDYSIAFANGVAQHADVILGVPRRRYERLAEWVAPEVDLRLLEWPRHRSLTNPRFLVELVRLVRRESPDIVHLLSHTNLWLNLAPPFWGDVPLVTTVHDVTIHPGDRETRVVPEWSSTWSVRQSAHVVVHGEGLRRRAIERFRLPGDRVHVLAHPAIPRYAEIARRRGLVRRADGPFNVLMFGRIYAYKGLELLIRAEAMLGARAPGLRLTIAGRGDDPWALRALMGDPGRYDVRRGFIDDVETAQLFLDADVVALPYVEASQSGVLNVAAAFGRPVVATDVGEIGATVIDAGIGAVTPPGDPAALANALDLLASQPSMVAELGARALAWAEGPNAPASVGATALDLYRAILARPLAATAPLGRTVAPR